MNIALTFSEVRGGAEVVAFFEVWGFDEAADVEAKQDKRCFKFIVLPEPERPMKTMDWSFLLRENSIKLGSLVNLKLWLYPEWLYPEWLYPEWHYPEQLQKITKITNYNYKNY